ncbi:serine/threonine-protein kinase dyf-5-like [Stegodyphus dumicola]|uniref:serine/threonine-protein kinase dyf-5-like n=1 Tax=Stegodyphus dumicola TaxID=202533 RepID=UPI0015AC16CB|nr:serine/threonine-protein kinase dyf-5-like [Stegodyphus dumicola]
MTQLSAMTSRFTLEYPTHPSLENFLSEKSVNNLELKEWPKLDHQNVLRLLDVYDIDSVVIFVTDLMSTNLFFKLQNHDFKKDPNAVEKCRIYATQILCGLAYLHSRLLCHLDLRAENIFITSDDKAVVADFSGLSWITDKKIYCPLPRSLKPPEMLTSKKKVEPMPIDLWAYGFD